MAACANGKVVHINFPLTTVNHGNQSQQTTATAVGQRMKELLHAINNVSVRMHQFSILASNQDKVLAELSKACHLAGELIGSHLGSSIFHTKVGILFRDEGNQCHMDLQCKVTNRSGFILSHGWSLIVCLTGNIDWPVDDVRPDAARQVTKIKDFKFGKSVTVIFPLDSIQVPLQLPLQVRWHFHFNLNEFTNYVTCGHVSSPLSTSKMELDQSSAVLTFTCTNVNLLLFLRPIQDTATLQPDCEEDSIQTAHNSGYDWLSRSLEAVTGGPLLTNRKSCKNDVTRDGPVSTTVIFKEEFMETIKADMTGLKGR